MARGYFADVRVTDFGPYVTKLVLPMENKLTQEPEKDGFSVYVERRNRRGEIMQLPLNWLERDKKEPSVGYAEVTDAYASDLGGRRTPGGDCITLELAYGPLHSITAEISAPDGFNVSVISEYCITMTKPVRTESGACAGLVFDRKYGNRCSDYAEFRESVSSDPELPLRYGYYVPQTLQEKKPLILWLHGAGEGGSETKIAYMGNKVTSMITPEIQELFDGAYLLVPQCPTMWLDDGSHKYGSTGRSMYIRALKAVIDEFISKNPGIDRDRIYIGGDSNGGFMTVRMCIDYPGFFAAAFPVCEALYDNTISDAQIRELAKLPMWFIHSRNDPVVIPAETADATYQRLKAAGAKNLHFSFFDCIVDRHEGWKNPDGTPFEYIGHFAWIPLFNRDCNFDYDGSPVMLDGRQADVFDWLARQRRQ
ncbi:prolyl oligopeptidase family serine peptidase [Lachnoclostridium sp. Marseille-P6806]|uniref:prolyl oligopeptidase family serine peptidase n=1 Tax=Lachnoclostridium sp. Marseille-P6806 TaxID=2364793 RepID=UPI00102F6F0B|nr:prolyl oligopeptidase family serine peptidase [Lachnoclostridium sp. Marseille-P6806]